MRSTNKLVREYHALIEEFLLDKRRSYGGNPCWSYKRELTAKAFFLHIWDTRLTNGDFKIWKFNLHELIKKGGIWEGVSLEMAQDFLLLLEKKGFITKRELKHRRDGTRFFEITMHKDLANMTVLIGKPKAKIGGKTWLRSLSLGYYANAEEYKKTKRAYQFEYYDLEEYIEALDKNRTVKKSDESAHEGPQKPKGHQAQSPVCTPSFRDTSLNYCKRGGTPSSWVSCKHDFEKKDKEFAHNMQNKYGSWEPSDNERELANQLFRKGLSRTQIGQFFMRFTAKAIAIAWKNVKMYTHEILNFAGFLWKACLKAKNFCNWLPKHRKPAYSSENARRIVQRTEAITVKTAWHRLDYKKLDVFARFTWECILAVLNNEELKWKKNVVNPNALLYSTCKKMAEQNSSYYSQKQG